MLDRHLEPFLSHLKVVRQLSPHTVSSYKRDLTNFLSFVREKKILGKRFKITTLGNLLIKKEGEV